MTTDTDQAQASLPRSEKISALTDLLGPDAMQRLRERHPGFGDGEDAAGTTDTTRVAWQRNRLLERLRSNWDGPAPSDKGGLAPAAADPVPAPARGAAHRIDRYIASGLSLTDLKHEHPAVIARVLRGLDRTARVSVLQELPGHIARAALQRLRSSQVS
jgi:hypothetical protein